jgi:OOP family OmpA-OmpF porin
MSHCFRSLLVLGLSGLLVACAPVSRVILLPQANGQPSAVEVTTGSGTQLLSQPYQTAAVSRHGQVQLGETSAAEISALHGQLLALKPAPEQRYELYFESGSTGLVPESKAQLDDVLAHALAQPGGEIIVTGHTDRVGSLEDNDALSLQRARFIRDQLLAQGFAPERIDAVGRGERAPLVATDDEVAEPRNRRIEIIVR